MNAGLMINVDVPVYRRLWQDSVHNVEIHVDPDTADMRETGALVNSIIQNAYDNVKVLKQEALEQQQQREERRSLKRRRTDEDFQRDRRRPNENIDFSLAGVNSRSHFRMRRDDPLGRSLQRFAEQKGKAFGDLRLFYQGHYVRCDKSADDLGLESGESLEVFELVD